jgi:hypothetical protein
MSEELKRPKRVGRPYSANGILAVELGLEGSSGRRYRTVQRLGGAERLRLMSEEARALMLGMVKKGQRTKCS